MMAAHIISVMTPTTSVSRNPPFLLILLPILEFYSIAKPCDIIHMSMSGRIRYGTAPPHRRTRRFKGFYTLVSLAVLISFYVFLFVESGGAASLRTLIVYFTIQAFLQSVFGSAVFSKTLRRDLEQLLGRGLFTYTMKGSVVLLFICVFIVTLLSFIARSIIGSVYPVLVVVPLVMVSFGAVSFALLATTLRVRASAGGKIVRRDTVLLLVITIVYLAYPFAFYAKLAK